MHRTLVILSTALTLAATSALAQQPSSGESLTDKAKQAAQAVGEKTRETAGKAMDKVEQAAQPSEGGQSGQSSQASSSARTASMQKQADADYKSAQAQCDTKEGQQKTLCEKEARAAHAQAELQVEKAKAMGAGPSQQQRTWKNAPTPGAWAGRPPTARARAAGRSRPPGAPPAPRVLHPARAGRAVAAGSASRCTG